MFEVGEFVIYNHAGVEKIVEIMQRGYGRGLYGKGLPGILDGVKKKWYYFGARIEIVETGHENIPLAPKIITGISNIPEDNLVSIENFLEK